MKHLVLVVAALFAAQAHAADWASWRGPAHNGVSPETNLPAKWSPDGENLIWKAPFGCRSTPIVMKGRVFLINYTAEHRKVNGELVEIPETIQERVMCLDADTGKVIWEMPFAVFHTDIVTVRLGWTNPIADPATGYVYVHGTQGYLFCLDGMAKEPKIVWQRQLTEEYGRISGYGGRVVSPTLFENMLIIGMVNSSWGDHGKGGNRFVAFDKNNGDVIWWSDPPSAPKDTYYSGPVIARIGGQDLLISGSCDGQVFAIKARTGEVVWTYKFGLGSVNCTPVVNGDLVYIGHGEENPEPGNTDLGRVVCLDAAKVKDGQPTVVWKHDDIKARYTSPVFHDGKLYITDDIGRLYCLDGKTGEQHWKFNYGRNSRGSPTLADGKIYIAEVNSKFHILDISGPKCKRLHQEFFPAVSGSADVELNGTPAIANGRVYFATSDELFCIGLKDAKPAKEPQTALPAVKPGEPTHLQIVPADVAVHPGAKVEFKLRTFDANGFLVGEVKASEAQWELPSPPLPPGAKASPPPLDGAIKDGVLTIDAKKSSQQGYVTATMGKLKGKARVRVAPVLPYVQDFSKVPVKAVPAGWVNTQGKFYVDEVAGKKVLKKVNDKASPLLAKGNAYIGLPDLKDYTIQADVMGTQIKVALPDGKVESHMPDIGIVANRYTLMLGGNIQKLRLVSWEALPRIDQTINFPWQPSVWYRLKLTTESVKGQFTVKGKIWDPTAENEPANWTVQIVDPKPVTEGAPALYGFVTGIPPGGGPGTEVLYANVKITPNSK
jgi:outer membrane protein assembly factor BamB